MSASIRLLNRLTPLLLLPLLCLSQRAIADPVSISECGGDNFKGRQKVSETKDKAGNVFTMYCVDKDYFEGTIYLKVSDKTFPFGRCVFPFGVNVKNFEYDNNGNFTEIEWVNVKPPTRNDRNDLLEHLQNSDLLSTDQWLAKVKKFLKNNNLEGEENSRFYVFPFPFTRQEISALENANMALSSPFDQEIGFFEMENITIQYVLTPDEAAVAYRDDGLSSIPALEIDPIMRVQDSSEQITADITSVPEPGTIAMVVLGLVALRRVAGSVGR